MTILVREEHPRTSRPSYSYTTRSVVQQVLASMAGEAPKGAHSRLWAEADK